MRAADRGLPTHSHASQPGPLGLGSSPREMVAHRPRGLDRMGAGGRGAVLRRGSRCEVDQPPNASSDAASSHPRSEDPEPQSVRTRVMITARRRRKGPSEWIRAIIGTTSRSARASSTPRLGPPSPAWDAGRVSRSGAGPGTDGKRSVLRSPTIVREAADPAGKAVNICGHSAELFGCSSMQAPGSTQRATRTPHWMRGRVIPLTATGHETAQANAVLAAPSSTDRWANVPAPRLLHAS
jgi:hypothetical protein